MGEVYLGEQVSLGRKVAIKVLHHDLHLQPGMLERFKREARLLSAVEHPALVRIIDFGESGDAACLVMELVEGESLFEVLGGGPLACARALTVLRQLAEGLAAIHDKGIIHRDIKPENVFLTRTARGEQARLLDFGIARLVEPQADSNVSQIGVVLGTPEYLSPEQAFGARVDARSDLYCLGVLAYRVLSGRLPFDGPEPRKYIAQHAHAAPLPLDRAAAGLGLSPALMALVMRLLEKDPANRFQSAHALADALAALAAEPVPPSIEAPAVTQSSGPPVASGTAAFGLAPPGSGAEEPPQPAMAPASSGTAAFGGAPSFPWDTSPPAPAPGPAAPSIPPPTGSGTALFGASSASLPPGASGVGLASKPQNLTLLLTSIRGYAELKSRQTQEQHQRMLETYERLLVPLLRAYDGKLVQKREDALLAVFGAPTGAVLCGMGMQDRLWRHNRNSPPDMHLHVRVCLHAGEVVLSRDTVLGEPLEVVKAAEQMALADEVTFTEPVNLARNRAEVEAEACGTIPLPGRGDALRLYRSKHTSTEGPPFGGRDMGEAPTRMHSVLPGALGRRLMKFTLARNRLLTGLTVAAVMLAVGGVQLWRWSRSPEVQARRLIVDGKPAEALKRLDAAPAEERKSPELRQVRALALHELNRHDDEHEVLGALEAIPRKGIGQLVLDALAEDFGADESDKGLRKLLGTLPKDKLRSRFESLAEGDASAKQWGALRYLEASQDTEGLDLVGLYAEALGSEDCGVRVKAARRLGALGSTKAIPALTKLAEQPPSATKSCGQDEAAAALQTLKKSN
jgi:serine/threonine-protein kinase